MTKRTTLQTLAIGFAGMAISASAFASAHIGPIAIEPETFDSFLACEAYLRQRHANDLQGTVGAPERLDDGKTREKRLKTDGVQRTGPEAARYKARVSWVVRSVSKTRNAMQTNSSYEESEMTCTGPVLQGAYSKGASMPVFVPLPDKADAAQQEPAH